MKNLFYIMLLAAVWNLNAADVYAASLSSATRVCQREAKQNEPVIVIKYNYGELQINHEKDADELKKTMSKLYPLEVKHTLNGLTSLSPYVVVESEIMQTNALGHYCYYPQTINIIIGYEPVVYIRNDLAEGSCRYNVTMRHEQTHLDIGYLSLQHFLQKVKKNFPQMVRDAGVIVKSQSAKSSADETSAELNARYRKQIGILFDRFVRDMIKQQMRIDTAGSYTFEGNLCSSGS